mmetsp:Transcript_50471/g.131316  ORF Transcript_50471/g.131316 Transcript_50471/m.131316 type:complete len:229 (+) Transcript_50471:214-900(+)
MCEGPDAPDARRLPAALWQRLRQHFARRAPAHHGELGHRQVVDAAHGRGAVGPRIWRGAPAANLGNHVPSAAAVLHTGQPAPAARLSTDGRRMEPQEHGRLPAEGAGDRPARPACRGRQRRARRRARLGRRAQPRRAAAAWVRAHTRQPATARHPRRGHLCTRPQQRGGHVQRHCFHPRHHVCLRGSSAVATAVPRVEAEALWHGRVTLVCRRTDRRRHQGDASAARG